MNVVKEIRMDNFEGEKNNLGLMTSEDSEKITTSVEIKEGQSEGFITRLRNKKGPLGILGGILAVMVKFKAITFLILTKLKFLFILLKLSKFASTLISMFVMIAVYASMYGWAYG